MSPDDIRREIERGEPHEDHPEMVHRLWACLDKAVDIAAEHKSAVLELAHATHGGVERFRVACERLAKAEAALSAMLPESKR